MTDSGRTIIIPHKNIRADSHMDGRRRFRITFEGTCVGLIRERDAGRGTRLKDGV
jgi:hypothetical protein